MTTKHATTATATVEFGRLDGDPHKIHVTTYHGPNSSGLKEVVEVSDEQWEAAWGDSTAEKIESLLGWGGMGQTEHDRACLHIIFG